MASYCLEYEIMSRYSLLSASEDLKKWTGFISTKFEARLISLVVPKFPVCENAYLENEDLDEKTVEYWSSVFEEIPLEDKNTVLELLIMLEEKILVKYEESSQKDKYITKVVNPELYSTVIEDIETIGLNNVVSLSQDFKELVFKKVDDSNREHFLKLNIPVKYPEKEPKVIAELPVDEGKLVWPKGIIAIHRMFEMLVEKYCKFWDDMDELDNRVKVVDPFKPNFSDYYRKILLEDNVIIHLTIDPAAPRQFPAISFSGPQKLVDGCNAAIDRECNLWQDTESVLKNLRGILTCDFVSKDFDYGDAEEEEPTPCTICYVYTFEGAIPETTCDCGAIFHPQCLNDLFASDLGKNNGIVRYVECPNCQLDVKVPKIFPVAELGAGSW